jgi:hypothetical protein
MIYPIKKDRFQMTGTRKKASEFLLKTAIVICVLFTLSHLLSAVVARIPPYSPGQCVSTPNPMVTLKVLENHFLSGSSIVEVETPLGAVDQGPISFIDLRNPIFKQTACP